MPVKSLGRIVSLEAMKAEGWKGPIFEMTRTWRLETMLGDVRRVSGCRHDELTGTVRDDEPTGKPIVSHGAASCSRCGKTWRYTKEEGYAPEIEVVG